MRCRLLPQACPKLIARRAQALFADAVAGAQRRGLIVIDGALRRQNQAILHRSALSRVEVDGRSGRDRTRDLYVQVGFHRRAVHTRIAAIHDDVQLARGQSEERVVRCNNRGIHVRKADNANGDPASVDARSVKRIQVVLHGKIARCES